jgi:hypothetical protein
VEEDEMNLRFLGAALASALTLTVPALAHHTHANFDQSRFIVMTGTVTEMRWMNPHVWFYMRVTDEAGRTRPWSMEGGSINALTQGGWTRDTIKAGDMVTVRCHPQKDGTNGCLMGFVTNINGVAMDKEFD